MAVLDKNGTEYLWNKAKEKFAAKDDVPETPEGVVLYTEQSLTDDQKAQARGNIGAVGTVEATEEAYTYVFTGEEEAVVYDASGVKYAYMEGVTIEFVNGISQFTYSNSGEIGTMDTSKGTENDLGEISVITDAENWLFLVYAKKDDATAEGMTLPKQGVYIAEFPGDDAPIISITSTVPYTKTTQKIDEALIPDHAHSWEGLEDKPFYYDKNAVIADATGVAYDSESMGYVMEMLSAPTLSEGEVFTVRFNGAEYAVPVVDGFIGNFDAFITGAHDENVPFIVIPGDENKICYVDTSVLIGGTPPETADIYISGPSAKKIDGKLVPYSNWDAAENENGFIENKPFGKASVIAEFTWDGDITGRETVVLPSGKAFCRVGDEVPNVTYMCACATRRDSSSSTSGTGDVKLFGEYSIQFICIKSSSINYEDSYVILSRGGKLGDVTIPSGVWFSYAPDSEYPYTESASFFIVNKVAFCYVEDYGFSENLVLSSPKLYLGGKVYEVSVKSDGTLYARGYS